MHWKSDIEQGFRDITPLALGVAIYGLAFGLLAAQASMDGLQTGMMGALVFAGASQIVVVERIVAGAGAMTAVLAGLALNLRLMMMTAALREDLSARPWWQVMLGVHLTSDENWALMHATRRQGHAVGYWYLVGGGLCLMIAWVISTTLGVTLAQTMPEPRALGMDFAFTAAFIAILRGLWRGPQADLLPWLISGGAVVLLVTVVQIESSWALVLAAGLGAIFAGVRRDA